MKLIEKNILSGPEIQELTEKYISKLPSDIEAIILGCTHYPLIANEFANAWQKIHKKSLPEFIDPGEEAAKKFVYWMKRKNYI